MRAIPVIFCALLLYPPAAFGKSLYVSCYRQIPVRAGTSLQSKVLTTLKAGQTITLVGQEGNYYVVTLANGAKGYVFKDYLTEQAPAETRLQEAQARMQEAEARLQESEQRTGRRIVELEAQTQAQAQELLTLRAERTQFEAAKKQAVVKTSLQNQIAAQRQSRQSVDKRDKQLRWLIAGASLSLSGFVVGRVWGARRRQNRRFGRYPKRI